MSAQRIHLVGIGGAGLSAIATVLLEQGYIVSGSDLCVSPTTERLAGMGATIYKGHAASNLGDAEAVVVSSAVPAGNPEVDETRRRGIPVYKRAEWLGRMMASERKRGIAVAGTHGKTTTTAMIALIARDAGLEPTFIVGGDIQQLGTGAAAGAGDVFIVEADEYDRTFLGLSPEIAVITVMEWDHPDCYPTPQSMAEAFQQFVASVPATGLVVGCGDEPSVQGLITHSRSSGQLGAPVVTYGLESGNVWRAAELHLNSRGGYDFSVVYSDQQVQKVSLAMPGVHNVKNALAALVVADRLGIPSEQSGATLAEFSGVARRFEVKGEAGGVLVIDDYAHHPTEIEATLAAARTRYRDRPIWAVFQPHTYSRTHALLDGFVAAFSDADHVIIVDIFAAREVDEGLVNSQRIVAHMDHPDTRYIGPLPEVADYLVEHLQPGAVLITLGAGDGYRVGEMVLKALKARSQIVGKGRSPAYDPGKKRSRRTDALADALGARFGHRLRRDEPLAKHTVLGVGGPADLWLSVTNPAELVEVVVLAQHHQLPLFLMGSGANVLVSDRGVRGLVVHNRCQQMVVEEGESPVVTVESGVILASLACKMARQGIGGLGWAIGIPGTVGGAVVNNAGAYGSSIADSLTRAEVLTPRGQREWQPGGWFEYEYRNSRLKGQPAGGGGYMVLQAELVLSHELPEQIEEQMARYSEQRKARQPAGATIGSMFKNPPGDYAGRLIEEAGLKGTQVGGAEISPVHANFFVNRGTARAADFAALIDLVHDAVQSKFGIDLELEIQKVGVWSESVTNKTRRALRKMRVGIVFGGRSSEHEVSLTSAQGIMKAIDKDKYDVVPIGIAKNGRWILDNDPMVLLQAGEEARASRTLQVPLEPSHTALAESGGEVHFMGMRLQELDVIFPVLHGPYGEDGTVQGFLDLLGVPYVGAGVMASAVCMDKAVAKDIFLAHRLPVLPYRVFLRRVWEKQPEQVVAECEAALRYPMFTKPANMGSSVGINKAHGRGELVAGLAEAARYDRKLIVERGIEAREIEVGVLGNDDAIASVPGEIIPSRSFYSYAAKYLDDASDLLIPAPISAGQTRRAQELAVGAYTAVDCAGMARVDFLMDKTTDEIWLNEINTIPGFTPISMYPKLWEATGVGYTELIDRLIQLAVERHQDKGRSVTSFDVSRAT